MIRLICIAVFLILYLILSIPVFLVEWLIGKFNPQARDISSLRIVQWGFKVILKMTGVKVTVIGEENIPDEPVLYVGNHRSFFDILLTYSRCKRLTGYIAKKEMEKVPLLSIWMRFVYCLFLDRENPKEGLKTILKAIEYIKNGCAIVPISMNNTCEIFEAHFPKIRKTHVVLEYGKPIYPDELDKDTKKHISEYVRNIIDETIHKNAELI